jgi:hypothetical protein
VYLFRRRTHAAGATAGSDAAGRDVADRSSPFDAALTSGGPAPGSAAEWALGELLIRLCNGGRGLRREPREPLAE